MNKETKDPKDQKNTKISIVINSKTNVNSVKCHSNKISFFKDLPCEILDFRIDLDYNTSTEGEEQVDESSRRYSGAISGIFSVPGKKFQQPFTFKIPLSLKYGTAIAFGFSTRDMENEKQGILNKFVFGDETVKPIVITKEIAVEIATYLINNSKNMDLLKKNYQKAIDFLEKNNISLNFLINHSEKKYQVGFYWEEFNLPGVPDKFKLSDILFGLSLDLKPESENKVALKVGGKATFGEKNDQIYLEYERDSVDQRLEFGGTLSVLTYLLKKMNVNVPSQLEDLADNASVSLEWIADVSKNISEEMKLDK